MRRSTKRDVTFRVTSSKPANRLQVGDQLWVKGRSAQVTAAFFHQGKKVLKTDKFGLIFADEVEMK